MSCLLTPRYFRVVREYNLPDSFSSVLQRAMDGAGKTSVRPHSTSEIDCLTDSRRRRHSRGGGESSLQRGRELQIRRVPALRPSHNQRAASLRHHAGHRPCRSHRRLLQPLLVPERPHLGPWLPAPPPSLPLPGRGGGGRGRRSVLLQVVPTVQCAPQLQTRPQSHVLINLHSPS